MKSLLIITGAGASYDAIDIDLGMSNRELRPPITENLFSPPREPSCKESEIIDKKLTIHKTAKMVGLDFVIKGKKDLEAYLTELKNNSNYLIRNLFWSIPLYLQELFKDISKSYIPNPDLKPFATNYALLIKEIIDTRVYNQIIWLNLNYDLFVDSALEAFVATPFARIDDYVKLKTPNGKLKIKYTKPHGSVNWLK